MSVQVSYKKQTLVLICLLIISLFIIEGLVQFSDYLDSTPDCYYMNRQATETIPYEIKKQVCVDFKEMIYVNYPFKKMLSNQHFATININEHGFRGPEITKEKPDNTYRIFMVGASTTFGTGSTSDETTIPGFLQQKFDASNILFDVQIVNAGISAAFSGSEVWLIKNEILEFDPDLLIIYDGATDVIRKLEYYGDIESDNNSNTQIKKIQILLDQISARISSSYKTFDEIDRYLSKTFFVKPLINDFTKDSEIHEKKLLMWYDRWKEICELGKEEGFEVIVTVQPVLGSSDRKITEDGVAILMTGGYFELLPFLENYGRSLKVLDKHCVKTADLRNVFDGINKVIYYDRVHMSDFGNEIVAQRLFELSLPVVRESYSNTQR